MPPPRRPLGRGRTGRGRADPAWLDKLAQELARTGAALALCVHQPRLAAAGGPVWSSRLLQATEIPDSPRSDPRAAPGPRAAGPGLPLPDLHRPAQPMAGGPTIALPDAAPPPAGPGGQPPEQPPAEPPVQALVHAAQRGDGEAFGQLYDRYVDLIYRYTYYRVGNAASAEDLTSETFVRALRRISSFTWQGRDFGAWLITIARNLVADHFKSARYRLEISTADLPGAGADRPAAGPEGPVLDGLRNAALLDAIRQLAPEQQECVVLRFFEGLSVAETALAMDRNAGAVKALQYRAVRALGRLLPEDFSR